MATATKKFSENSSAFLKALSSLSFSEKQLLLLVIINKVNNNLSFNCYHEILISADDYISIFHEDQILAYKNLKQGALLLFEQYVAYTEIEKGNIIKVKSRWISRISLSFGEKNIGIILTPCLVSFLNEIFDTKDWTSQITYTLQLDQKTTYNPLL